LAYRITCIPQQQSAGQEKNHPRDVKKHSIKKTKNICTRHKEKKTQEGPNPEIQASQKENSNNQPNARQQRKLYLPAYSGNLHEYLSSTNLRARKAIFLAKPLSVHKHSTFSENSFGESANRFIFK